MKNLFLLMTLFLFSVSLCGQDRDIYESVQVELNDQFLIVGESILLTAFCRSEKTGELSNFSKILYLELKGADGFSIKRKLSLKNGIGQDEIFLNSTIPTGQYTIQAYTRWMRNTQEYFEVPVVIINPFESIKANTADNTPIENEPELVPEPEYIFQKRSIETLPLGIPLGQYAVSINRVNDFITLNLPDGKMILNEERKLNAEEFIFIPEVRNEILEGKIMDSINMPIPNTFLTLTWKGTETNLVSCKSDENGNFLFHFKSSPQKSELFIAAPQLLNNYKIQLNNEFENYPVGKFIPNSITLDSFQRRKVVEKSIRNQIENAYLEEKSKTENSALPIEQILTYDRSYNLDDYTRFPSLPETFIEYVSEIGVRRKRIPVFTIGLGTQDPRFDRTPLILLDGVPVDSRKLLTFDPQEVKTINIIRNRFYLGSMASDGVLNLQTFNGRLSSFKLNPSIYREKLIPITKPYTEIFPQIKLRPEREPDQREQLYWNPNVNSSLMKEIEFTTSDVEGLYQLNISGITNKGKYYSESILLQVQ